MKKRLSLLLATLGMAFATGSQAWEPKGQAECIAPSNPGGGWDMTCRTAAAAMQKSGLYKETIYVSNMPGGSGAVAIANVIAKRAGDNQLIVAASNSLTFTIAMGRTPHSYADVTPIAQVGAEMGGLFVKTDSKFKSLADLVKAMKADPKSVSFAGGSAPGSQDRSTAWNKARRPDWPPSRTAHARHRSPDGVCGPARG